MARGLTDRQVEIAELVAAGKSTKAIARVLGRSPHTVKNHIERMAERIPGDGPPRAKIIRWYYSRQLATAE